ncbi:FG-GAP repeat domain-containing protein [Seohaeicola zhoushanensis]|uniref:VCBS repeat-containing protein n=1 Tax=Seohaeicola zhoushanensis TaxID=1569283 RepID=A0A8J3H0T8_9RHOB|nr:VCBS repeat-containing protein [Seohaeicola zhoushanensis]GHF61473.1 hypothetical protein GCM10017056_36140 [Seohaeicola zhoushanensis]
MLRRGAGLCRLALLGLMAATAAPACEARFPAGGLPGRSSVAPFINPPPNLAHENWAPVGVRMEFHAGFAEATDAYGHNIMGRLQDMRLLTIHVTQAGSDRTTCPAEALLPEDEVFEDIAPRIADLDGDGMPEVIVVQSDLRLGARLAIYDRRARLIAATPPIGQPHRWLAPLGADDLDSDGRIEIAYVDRPHLARVLRVWRFEGGHLTEVASAEGHTNHRIGDESISGGVRYCDGRAEIVTLDPAWRRIQVTTLSDGQLETRDHAALRGSQSLEAALLCR